MKNPKEIMRQRLDISADEMITLKKRLIFLGLLVLIVATSGIVLESRMKAELKQACIQAKDPSCM